MPEPIRELLDHADDRYRLAAVVKSLGTDGYRVDDQELDGHLVPKKPQPVTVERLHELGRGIGYTRSPFASCSSVPADRARDAGV